MDLTTVKLPCL